MLRETSHLKKRNCDGGEFLGILCFGLGNVKRWAGSVERRALFLSVYPLTYIYRFGFSYEDILSGSL